MADIARQCRKPGIELAVLLEHALGAVELAGE
jgi:hypothetical protein